MPGLRTCALTQTSHHDETDNNGRLDLLIQSELAPVSDCATVARRRVGRPRAPTAMFERKYMPFVAGATVLFGFASEAGIGGIVGRACDGIIGVMFGIGPTVAIGIIGFIDMPAGIAPSFSSDSDPSRANATCCCE